MNQTLPISEVFTSLQGEGRLTGTRSRFIRVSGCNLRCGWCDTPYASWNPEGAPRRVDDLVAETLLAGVAHVVLTGGEPMLFEAIEPLARGLVEAGRHVTIETAGTVSREVACSLMSLSPKLANSTPRGDARDPSGAWALRHEARRLDVGVLQRLLDAHPSRQMKFVVAHEQDLGEIEALLARLRGLESQDVMLMPEGVGPAPGREWIPAACESRGWTYCPRRHIEWFGNVRGT